MTTITRHILNPNIVLHDTDRDFNICKTTNYDQLCVMIDQWKTFLIEKYDAKPGMRLFIQGHPGAIYYSLFFATAELGMINVLDMPRCYTKEDVDSYKTKMFGVLDFIIRTHTETEIFGAVLDPAVWSYKANFSWERQRDINQSRHIITIDEFNAYPAQGLADVSTLILCNDDSILFQYPTSGTTADPKLITCNHGRMVTMSKRYAVLQEQKNTDRILHTNNLNHGQTPMIHFFPTVMTCDNHYFVEPTDYNKLVVFTCENKLNRALLYTSQMILDFLKRLPRVDFPFTIQTLYQITPEMVQLVKDTNTQIQGNFGTSDIGGTFFLKKVTPAIDLTTYDVTNLGKPLDDFFLLEVRDTRLWVACPTVEQDWVTTNDTFEMINGDFCFRGRANQYRIGETWLNLGEIEGELKKVFGDDATIAVDSDLQKVYLAIWKADKFKEDKFVAVYLQRFYATLTIDYIMRDELREQFMNDRKVDNSKIRTYCRHKLGLV